MRLAMAGSIIAVIAAALSCLEPDTAWLALGVFWVHDFQEGTGQGLEVFSVIYTGYSPAVGLEPILGASVDYSGIGKGVDAVIVPVQQVDQVVES